jgi:hypothetical protein
MGLDVVAYDSGGGRIFEFSVGGYVYFAAFKDLLVARIRGRAAAEKQSKERTREMLSTVMTLFGHPDTKELEAMLSTVRKGRDLTYATAAAASATGPDRPLTCPDLDLFLNHSDCEGEFTTLECFKLAQVFSTNEEKACKDSGARFKKVYTNFRDAFTAADRTGGKVVFC